MPIFFKKTKVFNVRMMINEEKILSNIYKVKKLINPNSKKQIIKLEEDSYFKDLMESITDFLVEYPSKNAFPTEVYKAAYDLVEYATLQFENNNNQIANLMNEREENIKMSYILREALDTVSQKPEGWMTRLSRFEGRFDKNISEGLTIIANSNDLQEENVRTAAKMIETKISNLESNLFIEIDIERIEDRSKALSSIGIELADSLKTIPAPIERVVEKTTMQGINDINQGMNINNSMIDIRDGVEEFQNKIPEGAENYEDIQARIKEETERIAREKLEEQQRLEKEQRQLENKLEEQKEKELENIGLGIEIKPADEGILEEKTDAESAEEKKRLREQKELEENEKIKNDLRRKLEEGIKDLSEQEKIQEQKQDLEQEDKDDDFDRIEIYDEEIDKVIEKHETLEKDQKEEKNEKDINDEIELVKVEEKTKEKGHILNIENIIVEENLELNNDNVLENDNIERIVTEEEKLLKESKKKVKPSFFKKIWNAITYVFKIKVVLDLPSNTENEQS